MPLYCSQATTTKDAMLALLADMGSHTSHRAAELGALLCMIGGLLLAGAGVRPTLRKPGLIAGGVTLAVGFAVLIVVLHYGETPFKP